MGIGAIYVQTLCFLSITHTEHRHVFKSICNKSSQNVKCRDKFVLKSEMRNRNQIWQESDSFPGNGIFFLVIVYGVHVQPSMKFLTIVDFDWVNVSSRNI